MEDGAPAIPVEVEQDRLRALHDLRVLDTAPEPHFDAIARTAASVMAASRAAILFIDRDRVWHKARVGIPEAQYPRQGTMADLMVVCKDLTIVEDVTRDPRLSEKLNALSLVDVREENGEPSYPRLATVRH